MPKKIHDWIIFILSAIGLFIALGGVNSLEIDAVGFVGGVCISFAGLTIIAVVIYYCNRNKKYSLTFSENLKILKERGF